MASNDTPVSIACNGAVIHTMAISTTFLLPVKLLIAMPNCKWFGGFFSPDVTAKIAKIASSLTG